MRGLLNLLEVQAPSPVFSSLSGKCTFYPSLCENFQPSASVRKFSFTMSEPAMDLESVAGPSNPQTPPGAASPAPYIPSAPFKAGAPSGLNPLSASFSTVPWGMTSSQFKRKRSDTIPGPPMVREDIALNNPSCNYWEQHLAQTVTDSGVDPSQVDFGFLPIILGFLTEIQTDYTRRISFVEDQLELEENAHKSTKSLLDHVTFKVKTLTSNRENLQIEPLLSPLPPLTKRQRKGQEPITRTGPLAPIASGSTPEPTPTIPPPPAPQPLAAPTSAPTCPPPTWAHVTGEKKVKFTRTSQPAPGWP